MWSEPYRERHASRLSSRITTTTVPCPSSRGTVASITAFRHFHSGTAYPETGFGITPVNNEADPRDYVARLTAVLAEAMRCLKPSGTLWLNVGDAYNTPINWRQDHVRVTQTQFLLGSIVHPSP